MRPIKMVDLHRQYQSIKPDVDAAIQEVLEATDFIQGSAVKHFENDLSEYLGGAQVISCANGTDALQIAMMSLGFKPGDEVILPVHTYVATAEVIALLQLVPVFAEVSGERFTLDPSSFEGLITKKTVCVVPVHLYGQCAEMDSIQTIADKHGLAVIEDAAQSLGADYVYGDNTTKKAGTLGKIGTTSFFPSKSLGAYGDGGAMITRDPILAEQLRMIANHGQRKKYQHDVIGVNSRLDTLQAAVLRVKLRHLDEYAKRRRAVADYYDKHLSGVNFLRTPVRVPYSTHVFHQYTVRIIGADRDALQAEMLKNGIPSMIYYPIPLHLQAAYRKPGYAEGSFKITEELSKTVLSLPIHTEMDEEQLSYICKVISRFG